MKRLKTSALGAIELYAQSTYSAVSDCYRYNRTADEWEIFGQLNTARYDYGLVQLNSDSFWVAGKSYRYTIYLVSFLSSL